MRIFLHIALPILLLISCALFLPYLQAADEADGNGTAFVVTEDGYLATCAHVVRDTKKVAVTIGERTYAATVVSMDDEHDLALLKIPAHGLTPLPLADSDAVELGQEVRAFGYPLSHLLGDDLKVTRGTVAGLSKREGSRVIQIDAAVNPGNSGGPLVDDRARVIGVVNAKISAEDVENVGFAVPINYLKRMLRDRTMTPATGESVKAALDGPALIKRISPSMAYVAIWFGHDTVINPVDNAEMVLVPAGDFRMGTSDADIAILIKQSAKLKAEYFQHEQPQHTVYLDSYLIYKTEVTVAQYRRFCADTGRKMPPAPPWGREVTHPILNVSWDDAHAYAQWAGADLPTEAEWEKAARGTGGRLYLWGTAWPPPNDTANFSDQTYKRLRKETFQWTYIDGYDDHYPYMAPVGSYHACASPYGALDMAGNAMEWCADWKGDDYYANSPTRNPQGPPTGKYRVIRGGSRLTYSPWDAHIAYRMGYPPETANTDTGFRCVIRLEEK